MRTAVIFLVLVGAVAAALILGGVFETEEPEVGPNAGRSGNGETDPGTRLGNATDKPPTPKERPPLELLPFPQGTKVLVIGAVPNTADQFMLKLLGGRGGAAYQGWYLNPTGASPTNLNKELPPLENVPTGLTLSEYDYDVVVLSNVNDKDLGDDFWDTLAKRVNAGQTNVLWRTWPPYPGGDADTPAVEHPWLTHPVIAGLLPVTEVLPLQGTVDATGRARLPGRFGQDGTRFRVTAKGETHPASRLVPWAEWSRVWWDELSQGDGAIRVKFCVPVTKLADGATALITADVKNADDIPAVVVGKVGDGRVMWLGTRELAWKAFYNPKNEARIGLVLQNMLVWLAGGGA